MATLFIYNMHLIKNASVYAPEEIGVKDVLIGGGKILKIGDELPVEHAYDITVIDGTGKVLMPGLIDAHVHILGGGGEGGQGPAGGTLRRPAHPGAAGPAPDAHRGGGTAARPALRLHGAAAQSGGGAEPLLPGPQ